MKVSLFATDDSLLHSPRCSQLISALTDASVSIVDASDADLLLSLGGDGTFLRAARQFGPSRLPIMGINAGRLGFNTAASIDETSRIASAIAAGDFEVESRSLLKVTSVADGEIQEDVALNEVAILKLDSASMISSAVRLNNRPLANYVGDGVIVATPTGSTGYNLSVGGPILEPTAPIFVISPIAAHSLSLRPVVVANNSIISIITQSRSGSYLLSVDGESRPMPANSELTLSLAEADVKVAYLKGHHFADVLRNKLLWGMDQR